MEKLTRQYLASQAAKRWKRQYAERGKFYDPDKERIYEQLTALGDAPIPDAVDAAIGNNTWTEPPSCSECREFRDVIIRVGDEPDYESETAWLCETCLRAAIDLVASAAPTAASETSE